MDALASSAASSTESPVAVPLGNPGGQRRRQHHHLLAQGIEAAQAEDKVRARMLFHAALKVRNDDEETWLWLASVAENQSEIYLCMQHVLEINPQHEHAREWLRQARELGISEKSAGERSTKETRPIPADWKTDLEEVPAADETVFMGNAAELFG